MTLPQLTLYNHSLVNCFIKLWFYGLIKAFLLEKYHKSQQSSFLGYMPPLLPDK